jgi:Ecdysteroid kinase-like family
MTDFPHQPEDLTAEWLGAQVGAPVTDFELEQIGIGVGLLGRLYRITLTGEGAPATVVAKFPTLDEGARTNVASPLGFYSNEVNFYRDAAPHTPIATPRVYSASFDADSGDFVLLLEDIADRRCADQTVGCDATDAETAIEALARMHAHWWDSDFAPIPWVKSYVDAPYPQVIAALFKNAWPTATELLAEHMAPSIREFGERFPDLVDWFLAAASRPPVTLCHGDYRLDNLFFAAADGHAAVTVVDWQICFRGNAGYDLGYFVSQSLATETRRACQADLLDSYHAALAAAGIEVDRTEIEDQFARTVAYCFIYPITAAGQIEVTNERHLQLLKSLFDRSVAAIEDVDALSLLPA